MDGAGWLVALGVGAETRHRDAGARIVVRAVPAQVGGLYPAVHVLHLGGAIVQLDGGLFDGPLQSARDCRIDIGNDEVLARFDADRNRCRPRLLVTVLPTSQSLDVTVAGRTRN